MRRYLYGPPSKFQIGEAVESIPDGNFMVVRGIYTGRRLDQPLIECLWYDPFYKAGRRNLFRESSLAAFDWFSAARVRSAADGRQGPYQLEKSLQNN